MQLEAFLKLLPACIYCIFICTVINHKKRLGFYPLNWASVVLMEMLVMSHLPPRFACVM